MPGIRLLYAHRLQTLADGLASSLAPRVGDASALFDPVDVVVPNWNMRLYLEQEWARTLGVTPNVRFHLLRGYLADALPAGGAWENVEILGREALHPILIDLLSDLDQPWLEDCPEVRSYLDTDDPVAGERRLYQFARELAGIFAEYSFSRSAPVHGGQLDEEPLLVKWRRLGAEGVDRLKVFERWQQCLWWRVFGDGGALEAIEERTGTRYLTLADAFAKTRPAELEGVPQRFHVVGFAYMARLFIEAMDMLGQRSRIDVHALTPCRDWVETGGEDAPTCEHLLLNQWGSAGADHSAMWSGVAEEIDFVGDDAGRAESPSTVLEALQADIVSDGDVGQRNVDTANDDSLRFFECPSIKREVESVANSIWTRLRASDTLHPDDIAVLIAGSDRDEYLAQIESTFSGFRDLPHTIVDLPAASGSRMLEAVRLLLELPFGRFRRRELLSLLSHPNLRGRGSGVDPEDWVAWADRLGILYGADREALDDTYLGKGYEVAGRDDYEWDLYNWDQGFRRLVLGTFLSGEHGDEPGLFRIGNSDYEPLEVGSAEASGAARLLRQAGSLIEDARWLTEGEDPNDAAGGMPTRTAQAWSEIIGTYLETYLTPAEREDAYEFEAARRIVQSVGEESPVDGEISYRVFLEFLRDRLDDLEKTHPNGLTGGVVVSACLPMRSIPFEHIYVVGLGEGQFPNPDREDPLDLRYQKRQPGDLKPVDRDRYTFLETLLAADESATLSWGAREATTGEDLEASSVVNELRWALEERLGIPAESEKALTVRHPLRRYDDAYFPGLAERVDSASEAPEADKDMELPSHGLHPEARREATLQALADRLCGGRDGRPRTLPSLDELRRELLDGPGELPDGESTKVWETLRQNLALPRIRPTTETDDADSSERSISVDENEPEEPPERIRLRLSQLRGFLESPLQGAAKVQLGLREDEDDAMAQDWEPVSANRLHTTIYLRDIIHRVVEDGDYEGKNLERMYEEHVLPMAPIRTEFPSGSFLEDVRKEHLDILRTWRSNLDFFDIEGPLRRSGIGREDSSFETSTDPITFEFEPEETFDGRRKIVELVGKTAARTTNGANHVSFFTSKAAKTRKRTRYLTRAFLRAAASIASGLQSIDSNLEFFLNVPKSNPSGQDIDFRMQIGPWEEHFQTSPRAYLRELVRTLLFDSHEYIMPVQYAHEVFNNELIHEADRTHLSRWLNDDMSGNYNDGYYQYGPIKDYRRFGAPRDLDVASTLRTRYPHLFRGDA